MDRLPEELLEHIISYLDTPPPSQTQNPQEPSVASLFSTVCPLKSLMTVSRQWRRLVEPVLFKYLKVTVEDDLRLGALAFKSHKDRAVVDRYQLREWTNPVSDTIFIARFVSFDGDNVVIQQENGLGYMFPSHILNPVDTQYVQHVCRHAINRKSGLNTRHKAGGDNKAKAQQSGSFFDFLSRNMEERRYMFTSLVVHDKANTHRQNHVTDVKDRATLSNCAYVHTQLWTSLKAIPSIRRLVLLCSPYMTAQLLACHTNTDDLWSFDIPHQRVELLQNKLESRSDQGQRSVDYEKTAEGYPNSLLHMRHWDSFEYDEGSSLNAYGTYHYFEKVRDNPVELHHPSPHVRSLCLKHSVRKIFCSTRSLTNHKTVVRHFNADN